MASTLDRILCAILFHPQWYWDNRRAVTHCLCRKIEIAHEVWRDTFPNG